MKEFEKLLDSVYELEGLLHLAVVRDLPPATLTSLIKRKGLEVLAALQNLPDIDGSANGDVSVQPNDISVSRDDVALSGEDVVSVEEDTTLNNDDFDSDNFNLTGLSEDDEYALDDADDYLSDISDLPEFEEEATSESDDARFADSAENTSQERVAVEERPQSKLSFSINERFRFRRTLFRNSDRDFNLAVASISACRDYNDAYDMLINEYGWNEEDPEVQDFLKLISNYFKYKK